MLCVGDAVVALAVIAGLLVLGLLNDVFSFDGALNGVLEDVANFRNDDENDEDTVTVEGSSGQDRIDGTEDSEDITTGNGADTVNAGSGNDRVNGGDGPDRLFGDTGDDTLFGGNGDDFMNGRSGNDILYGGEGQDTMRGGIGDDVIVGYHDTNLDTSFEYHDIVDPDRIYGNDGDDTIVAGSGDTVIGGTGSDTITLGSWIDPDNPVHVDDYDPAEDKLYLVIPDDYAGSGRVTVEHDSGGNHSGTIYLDGEKVAEITGSNSQQALRPSQIEIVTQDFSGDPDQGRPDDPNDGSGAPGGDGDAPTPDPDTTIEGTRGADLIDGSSEDEEINAGNGADTVNAGSGDDLVNGGDGADRLFGDNGLDTLVGGAGSDFMNGRAGDDYLIGEAGEDTMRGGIGDDVLFGYHDASSLEMFARNDEADPDRIYGNEGDDIIIAGTGDTVTGGEGNDWFTVGSWVDPTDPVHIEDYAAGEDGLYVFVPQDYSGPARITIDHHPGGDQSGAVLLDGVKVAEVTGANAAAALRASNVMVIRSEMFS